ncbi:MAG: DDE-type integrase/transposase/recombinase [Nanoarchaeota archaeon]
MKPKLKGRQHYDEKYIKVNGKDHYDLNCIDHKTKYITAHLFVEKRTFPKCVEFLRQIKITCYDQILERYKQKKKVIFVSDMFGNYKGAFNKLFLHVAILHFGVPIKAKVGGLKHNNNPIERYNGDIKDRIKIMRGEFRDFEKAEAFLNLKRIIHNFVNPHLSLGEKTPAEVAEINLELGQNKLLELIKKRAQKSHHSLR